jgi:hypothetical protein
LGVAVGAYESKVLDAIVVAPSVDMVKLERYLLAVPFAEAADLTSRVLQAGGK